METTTIRTTNGDGARRAAVNALAIVGFIVLLFIGMALAVYAARFIPAAVSNIGSAAVYLSSQVFPSEDEGDLVVVGDPETVPFGEDEVAATSTPATTTPTTGTGGTVTNPRPGTPTTVVVPVQVPASTNYHGLPDLVVESVVTGYLNTSDTSSFRASDEVPDGKRGAVKFTVINRGTNVSGRFEFEVELPTTRTYTYNSRSQQSLRPGERIEYVLGFDRTREGQNRTIAITVDPDDEIDESNERNNDRSVSIDIED
ncbi:MAG TPA: CARDB domain-containing protein [Candidatus Paceibacterota bacterium]|nr:CARDB domain-containing protein [Candidatus Paceibacterota bacterium]